MHPAILSVTHISGPSFILPKTVFINGVVSFVFGLYEQLLRSKQLITSYCHSTGNRFVHFSPRLSVNKPCLPLVGWPLILYSKHNSIFGTDISHNNAAGSRYHANKLEQVSLGVPYTPYLVIQLFSIHENVWVNIASTAGGNLLIGMLVFCRALTRYAQSFAKR